MNTCLAAEETAALLSDRARIIMSVMRFSRPRGDGTTILRPHVAAPAERAEIESAISELLKADLVTAGPGFGRQADATRLVTTEAGRRVCKQLHEQLREEASKRWLAKGAA